MKSLKCEFCGLEVKDSILSGTNGFVLSKSSGQLYKNQLEFLQAGEEGDYGVGFTVLCKNCGQMKKQRYEDIEKEKYEDLQCKLKSLVITTTASIDGKKIIEYKGIITAQVFMGVNLFKDVFSGLRDIVGGRSKAMENELKKAKDLLLEELKKEALDLGANAIIGLKIDFEDVGKTSGNAFMLLGTGTAVFLE